METEQQFYKSTPYSKVLSVIIPAFNEGHHIYANILQVCETLQGLDFEVVVVDDGSLDNTFVECQRAAAAGHPVLSDRSRMVAKMGGGEQHVQKFSPPSLAGIFQKADFQTVKLGTFYQANPFASMLSNQWAETLLAREVKRGGLGGMIIYYLGQKPNDKQSHK
jgi:glycosyltransferase involved in cell wall biosynthesis